MNEIFQTEQLIKFLKTNYLQLKKITKVSLLHQHVNGKSYLINSEKGKFILKYFLDNSKPEKIERMCEILHSGSFNSKVEEPVLNKNGTYVHYKEKCYLTKYYEGNEPQGNIKEMKDLAYQLARLHQSLKKTKIPFNYKTHFRLYLILKKSELKHIHTKILRKKKLDQFDRNLLNNIHSLEDCINYDLKISLSNKFLHPKQLIHNDLHMKNLLFKNCSLQAFVDFTTMKKGYPIEDVSFCALRFALIKNKKKEKINEIIKPFLKIYQNYNTIPPQHLENFSFFLSHKILSGLSFILKNHYYKSWYLWDCDLEKYFNLLKLVRSENFVKN